MRIFLLVSGLFCTATGALSVFNHKYVTFMRTHLWEGEDEKRLFPGRSAYYFARYVRGGALLVAGIGAVLFAFFAWK